MTKTLRQRINAVRAAVPVGTMLFFRTGDYYECYDDDAVVVGDVLRVGTTKRGDIIMAGFPAHALGASLAMMIRLGRSCAVIKQEVPA